MTRLLTVIFVCAHQIYFSANPIATLYKEQNLRAPSILIALNPEDCSTCMIPINQLIDRLIEANPDVPIYILSDRLISGGERILFLRKNGLSDESVTLIADSESYQFLISNEGGAPTIAYVSSKLKVSLTRDLKNEDLTPLYEKLIPPFSFRREGRTEFNNEFISTNRGSTGFILLEKSWYVLYPQYKLISIYNEQGMIRKNVFLDSLNLPFFALCRDVFSQNDYDATVKYLKDESETFVFNKYVYPRSMFLIGKDTIALATRISASKDTIYNGRPAVIQQTYCVLLLFDPELKHIGHLSFPSQDAIHIEPACQLASIDNKIYCFKYNKSSDKFDLSEYGKSQKKLLHIRSIEEPLRPKDNDYLQIISQSAQIQQAIYITYKTTKSKANVFKYNVATLQFEHVIKNKKKNIYGFSLCETSKGNFIFLKFNSGNEEFDVIGYNTKEGRFITQSNDQNVRNNKVLFPAYNGVMTIFYNE